MKTLSHSLKAIILFTMLTFAAACSSSTATTAAVEPTLLLNGVEIENSGLVEKKNTMYVPASFITETLGASIEKPKVTTENDESGLQPDAEQLEELDMGVYYRNQVAVLMYHAIMEEPTDASIISAKQFREHMQWLKEEGFTPISIEQYDAFIHEAAEVPDNAVLITFDDGYENFYTYAFPILKEFGYAAVNFVIVSGVDDPSLPGIKKLSWEQMREMKEQDIAFHNHTYDMHAFGAVNGEGIELPVTISNLYRAEDDRMETDEEYIARVTDDLSKAEQRLQEELGNTLSVIAFPYGAYNERLLNIIDSLDIRTAFTIQAGMNTADDKLGYRINAGRSDQTAEELLSVLKPKPVEITDHTMLLNGKLVTFTSIIKPDGNYPALYPLREVSNALGLFIGFDKETRTVMLTK
ncbi:polysaccharide deacetylase family protein [Paenibacillus sp. FSL W7-1287]|uniref:polysaccharide deacetylase family protein n=1 Tax=Paenibacillus sp. FSL W7-1287 TaxID=2954538 RepID=UPI0030F67DFE